MTVSINLGQPLGSAMIAEPTRTNYNFVGWNTAADGSGNAIVASTMINGSLTAYAQWKAAGDDHDDPDTSDLVIEHFGKWTGSGNKTSTVNKPSSTFVRLLLNGTVIGAHNYTVHEGSTVIELKEAYLKTLSNGAYTYSAEFTDSTVDLSLVVETSATPPSNAQTNTSTNSSTPQTGDSKTTNLLLVALIALLFGTASLLIGKRRQLRKA